jgi:D-alanyl-lipoteichoic acid acyltransferase DltB (MBOAT superfamily)
MVFSSFQFIFIFLPAAYIGFLLAHRIGGWKLAIRFLAAASLAFYAMWGLPLFIILLASLVFNFGAGHLIGRLSATPAQARLALFGGIAANLGLIGYLKYTNFFIDVTNQVAGTGFDHINLLVPVGVSFFTFIQIGYLIDAYNGQRVKSGFGRYVVFAAFFPCVTAGPLVMQREIMDQLEAKEGAAFDLRRLVTGMTMFGMGLFKKVVLADSIAPYANTVFDGVSHGGTVDMMTAWIGSTCYALQLYFDFSGYSDMALGIAFVFGISLPLNFDSPFKADNISDFWRRWHMTMTRFFTNYIFSGMAMNGMRAAAMKRNGRVGKFIRSAAIPVTVTFLVAGIWHGAGWNMVVYGLIHGVAIATCLGWREFGTFRIPGWAGWAMTMSVVLSALVVFRAPDLEAAGTILANMWGLSQIGIGAAPMAAEGLDVGRAVSMIILMGAIVLLLPNTQQILHKDWLSSDAKPQIAAIEAGLLAWRPAIAGAFAIAGAYTIALTSIGAGNTFLYYQF